MPTVLYNVRWQLRILGVNPCGEEWSLALFLFLLSLLDGNALSLIF